MKRPLRLILLAALMIFAFGLAAPVTARDQIRQQKCPVMGYKPVPKYYVDYEGKRIYFCCASCPAQFQKDPEKYMQQMREQGIVLEDAPQTNDSKP